MKRYYVYILKCVDGSYYTGISSNLQQRFREHQSGEIKGCYTQSRLPVQLMYYDYFHDVYNAIAFEKQVKGWSRRKKEALIESNWDNLELFSKNYSQFGNPIKK